MPLYKLNHQQFSEKHLPTLELDGECTIYNFISSIYSVRRKAIHKMQLAFFCVHIKSNNLFELTLYTQNCNNEMKITTNCLPVYIHEARISAIRI